MEEEKKYYGYESVLNKQFRYKDSLNRVHQTRIGDPSDLFLSEQLRIGHRESKTTSMFKSLKEVADFTEKHGCISPLAALFD